MRYLLLMIMMLTACGGYDDTTLGAGETFRIDGTPWEDGFFANEDERDEWCAAEPDQPMCSELGSLQQPWRNAEYHGKIILGPGSLQGKACHLTSNSNCTFPKYKQVQLKFDQDSCWDALEANFRPESEWGFALVSGIMEGIAKWHNKGGATVAFITGGFASNKQQVTVRCVNSTANWAGLASTGSLSSPMANIQTGPTSGNNPQMAHQYQVNSIDINVTRLLSTCGVSSSTLNSGVKVVASHELGHILGFAHFQHASASPMNALAGCFDTPSVAANFVAALGDYNGSGGSATITNRNLNQYQPEQ